MARLTFAVLREELEQAKAHLEDAVSEVEEVLDNLPERAEDLEDGEGNRVSFKGWLLEEPFSNFFYAHDFYSIDVLFKRIRAYLRQGRRRKATAGR